MRRPEIDQGHVLAGAHHVRSGIAAHRSDADDRDPLAHDISPEDCRHILAPLVATTTLVPTDGIRPNLRASRSNTGRVTMDIAERTAAAAGNEIDRPVPSAPSNRVWGSDAIAAVLRELDIPYIALNPGASYRGIHDSLVNYLGNTRPRMLLCLHEESAVALAHGYAKVTGRPMAAFVHSNVGLMHATMAIFNAWCDRAPVLVLGATGPMDSTRRRPWIEWIHTARDQGALIRNFTKWDDQPASVASAQEAILRAWMIANTEPRGPVYINFDLALQEDEFTELPPMPTIARHGPPVAPEPAGPLVRQAAELLAGARRPLILAGRGSRDPAAWQRRVALAEAIGARVVTDRKSGATFPTDHPLHVGGTAPIVDADVILSLDWVDLAGTLRTAHAGKPVTAKIIQVSVDQYVHNGWSMDYQGLPPVDAYLLAEPDAAAPALLAAVKGLRPNPPPLPEPGRRPGPPLFAALDEASIIQVPHIATALHAVLGDAPTTMIRLPLSWADGLWEFRHPLDYLGTDGGGGARRRRLPDGGHGAVDGGAQQRPVAGRRGQQPLLLQRRTAPGARCPAARPAARKPLDRPGDPRPGHRPGDDGARPGLHWHRAGRGPKEAAAGDARSRRRGPRR